MNSRFVLMNEFAFCYTATQELKAKEDEKFRKFYPFEPFAEADKKDDEKSQHKR
jgi:hypothetical protein